MASLTIHQIGIIELFIGTGIWGAALTTTVMALGRLCSGKSASEVNRPVLVLCVLMPLIATTSLVLNVVRQVMLAGGGGADVEFGSATQVSRYALIVLLALLGDGMLVWRCCIVYRRSWRVALVPSLLWSSALGLAVAVVALVAVVPGSVTHPSSAFHGVLLGFWGASVLNNVLCTSLIVFQLHKLEKASEVWVMQEDITAPRYSHAFSHATRVIMESGLIYTLSVVLTLITVWTNSVAVYPISAFQVQSATLAFDLIVLRISHPKPCNATHPSMCFTSVQQTMRSNTKDDPRPSGQEPVDIELRRL